MLLDKSTVCRRCRVINDSSHTLSDAAVVGVTHVQVLEIGERVKDVAGQAADVVVGQKTTRRETTTRQRDIRINIVT